MSWETVGYLGFESADVAARTMQSSHRVIWLLKMRVENRGLVSVILGDANHAKSSRGYEAVRLWDVAIAMME
jgi:hypothetical protein